MGVLNADWKGRLRWEAIALGLDIPPLQMIAELLGEDTSDVRMVNGQLKVFADLLKELTGEKRKKAEIFMEGFLYNLQRIKEQP